MVMAGFLLCMGAAGCATTGYRVKSGQERSAFHGKVLVFEKQVPRNVQYRIIGDFVEQKQWYGSTAETGRESLSVAASRGANGLLIEKSGHRPTAWSWSSPYTEGKLLWVENYDAAAAAQGGEKVVPATEQRMRQLDDLHRKGLVTDTEYEAKRKAILESL